MTRLPRVNHKEAMDETGLDPALLAGDLRNLEVLNRFFGGAAVIRRHLPGLLAELPDGHPLLALDIGSGAGDLCRELVGVCRAHRRPVRLLSLDFHPQIQEYARESAAGFDEIRQVRADARALPFADRSFDLVLCTLALHHFAADDAAAVLGEMRRVARRWALVSDLCRSVPGYIGVWLATRLMRNPMTRNDGPLSVRRAFTGEELLGLAKRAGWEQPQLQGESWFRMSLLYRRPR
jgi:ubiquinone/menaquinone biosynthesis C-methylase UbiE